jgi:signal transduction histidine kinase
MKSEFLANMSHELRRRSTPIIGFSEVLRDGLMGEMTEQQRGSSGDIFGSGKHLLSADQRHPRPVQGEAGKMTLDWSRCLPSLFVNSLSIHPERPRAPKSAAHWSAAGVIGRTRARSSRSSTTCSQRGQVQPRGGLVTLRRRVPRPTSATVRPGGPQLALADSDFADFLEISVVDTGIGIAPEEMESLFKPFSQIDSGLARRFEGPGSGWRW